MPANDLPWRKWIPKLVVALCAFVVLALAVPFFQSLRESARRSQSKTNLKQIGLAFHNYHDVYQCLPPGGTFAADGTPMHGWAAGLMPYIDSNPYFDRINFDRPWDDPFNRPVFLLKWPVYLNPQVESVQTADGLGLLHYPGNTAMLPPNGSVGFKDIAPGLSEVWICSEAFERWQPWGSPFNWRELDWPPAVAEGETAWSEGGAHLLMFDGRVTFFSQEASRDQAFREMIGWKPDLPVPAVDVEFPEWDYEPYIRPRNMTDEQAARLNDTIALYDESYEGGWRVTARDLADAVGENPTARVLLTEGLNLNNKTLPSVLRLKQLEHLDMARITLSEDDLQQLAKLKSLKLLDVVVDPETAKQLKELLPDCELRLHVVDQEASANDSDPKTGNLQPDDDP